MSGSTVGPDFKAPGADVRQDWERLAGYLAGRGFGLAGPGRQFAGGYGNLNYLVEVDGEPVVLRRPPMGPIPPGANDMRRESTVLAGLWRAFPLAPRCRHFCDDETVLGAPFFLMDYRPGLVIGPQMPEALLADGAEPGRHLGPMLVGIMADLHAVDPASVGLADFGRPEGFLQRTLQGWSKRAELSWDDALPTVVRDLIRYLNAERALPEQPPALIHNDYKLDNTVLDPGTLAPTAVLDWDLCTRGDPLVDLAVMLAYWAEAGDPPVMEDIQQMPSAGHGFPRRHEAAALYGRRTGRDMSAFAFYRAFGVFRLAVVFMQLNHRFREGAEKNRRFAEFGRFARELMEFAYEIHAGRAD